MDDLDSDNDDADQQLTSVDSQRYPSRSRHPPTRLADYIRH